MRKVLIEGPFDWYIQKLLRSPAVPYSRQNLVISFPYRINLLTYIGSPESMVVRNLVFGLVGLARKGISTIVDICCLRRRSYCLPWIASVLEHFHIRTDGRFDWESFKKTVRSRLLGRRIQTQDRSRSMACHYDTLRVHSSHRVQMLTAQHTVSFA